MNLPGYDIQVDAVERDDIIEGFHQPARPHCAGPAHGVFSKHTETLTDVTDECVDVG